MPIKKKKRKKLFSFGSLSAAYYSIYTRYELRFIKRTG